MIRLIIVIILAVIINNYFSEKKNEELKKELKIYQNSVYELQSKNDDLSYQLNNCKILYKGM